MGSPPNREDNIVNLHWQKNRRALGVSADFIQETRVLNVGSLRGWNALIFALRLWLGVKIEKRLD